MTNNNTEQDTRDRDRERKEGDDGERIWRRASARGNGERDGGGREEKEKVKIDITGIEEQVEVNLSHQFLILDPMCRYFCYSFHCFSYSLPVKVSKNSLKRNTL